MWWRWKSYNAILPRTRSYLNTSFSFYNTQIKLKCVKQIITQQERLKNDKIWTNKKCLALASVGFLKMMAVCVWILIRFTFFDKIMTLACMRDVVYVCVIFEKGIFCR